MGRAGPGSVAVTPVRQDSEQVGNADEAVAVEVRRNAAGVPPRPRVPAGENHEQVGHAHRAVDVQIGRAGCVPPVVMVDADPLGAVARDRKRDVEADEAVRWVPDAGPWGLEAWRFRAIK